MNRSHGQPWCMNHEAILEKAVFCEAVELDPQERGAFLRVACRGDENLRKRLEELLATVEESVSDSETPGLCGMIESGNGSQEGSGSIICKYRLLEQLGEGGMGVVYLAQQEEPVRRRVALKVIKLGMDTRQVIARFEAERQALALMDHPNIARVFDAGTIETGRPYFVMELVGGVKITDYCVQAGLSPRRLLDLFIQVCKAVQHAHQKGVIHRDLKPSNILVTVNDGVAVPKIIDFGIAKAMSGQALTEKTLLTRVEQLIGTPAYMSPEQAQMSGQDIDTRSDIYSLGVLLYEMLSGETPFDSKELVGCGMDEMRRIIRQREPVRPSTRLAQVVGEGGSEAGKYNEGGVSPRPCVQTRELIGLLRGDLDCIVMKCLEKDRSRRYETANGLAMDLERFLNDEAVVARPPSPLYRFQKLVRRNKLTFGAAAAVTAALVFGIIASSWQAARATKANAEANRLLYVSDIDRAHRALEEGNVTRAEGLLDNDYPKAGKEDLRGFEWYALKRMCRGDQLFSFPPQTYTPLCVAFSPDGKLLVTGNGNCDPDPGAPIPPSSLGELHLFDLATQREATKFPPQATCVTAVTFSRDDQMLASGHSDGTIVLWNVHGQRVRTLSTGPGSRIIGLQFSPRQQGLVSAACDGTITLWDSEVGRQEWTTNVGGPVSAVAFSADGSRLALGGTGPFALMDLDATNKLMIPWDQGTYLNGLAFSPDGNTLAIVDANSWVQLLDLRSLPTNTPCFTTLGKHLADANAVAFFDEGAKLITGSGDSTLGIWDVRLHNKIRTLKGHRASVLQIAISPGGKTVGSVSEDKTVKLWQTGPQPEADVLGDKGDWVWSADLSSNGTRLVTGHWDTNGTIRIWDLGSGQCLHTFLAHTGGVCRALFSKDSQFVISGGVDQEIKIWDAENPGTQPLRTLPGHEGTVKCLCLSPDGRTLVSGSGYAEEGPEKPHAGIIKLWDLRTFHETASFQAHDDGVYCMAISPDGRVLATGSWDTTLKLWDMRSQKKLAQLKGHGKPVHGMVFFKDGKVLVSTDEGGELIFWDVARGKVETRERLVPAACDLALSPDGKTLIEACGSGTVRLRNVLTRRELMTLRGQESWGTIPAISRDGRVLAMPNADGTTWLWPAGRF